MDPELRPSFRPRDQAGKGSMSRVEPSSPSAPMPQLMTRREWIRMTSPLRWEPGSDWAGDSFGDTANLETAHHPRIERGNVVDHERNLPVGRDIVELPGVPQVAPSDLDDSGPRIDFEADGAVLQRPVRPQRGQATEPLGTQVFDLGRV